MKRPKKASWDLWIASHILGLEAVATGLCKIILALNSFMLWVEVAAAALLRAGQKFLFLLFPISR